jgi:hypothetical protein
MADPNLVVTNCDAPSPKKFVGKFQLIVGYYGRSRSACPNKRDDHLGFRTSVAARQREGFAGVYQYLNFRNSKL